MKKVAIFLIVGEAEGAGGIERYYLNFIEMVPDFPMQIDIITSEKGRQNIRKLSAGFPLDRVHAFPVTNNRFFLPVAKSYLFFLLLFKRYKLVHIANFDAYYRELYRFIGKFTKLSLNLIDCRFSPEFEDSRYAHLKNFISKVNLSAVYSWYKNTDTAVRKLNPAVYFKAATVCFTDYKKFSATNKEKIIVFAARLSETKRPEDYLRAISILKKKHPDLCSHWKFELLGKGEIYDQVLKTIRDFGLEGLVKTGFENDLSKVYNHSSIFVSTQRYENFTSLSMLEAMAAGNAIVSYNVGQTDYFVENGKNGLLTDENPEALAEALFKLMSSAELLRSLQSASAKMAREVHNVKNFSDELQSFWNQTLALR